MSGGDTRLPAARVAELARAALPSQKRVFHAPNIPAVKVRAAAATLLRHIGPLEQLLALIDLSLLGSGRDGAALLDQRFVYKPRGGEPFSVRYEQLRSEGAIEQRGGTVYAKEWPCPMGSEELAVEFARFLRWVAALTGEPIEAVPAPPSLVATAPRPPLSPPLAATVLAPRPPLSPGPAATVPPRAPIARMPVAAGSGPVAPPLLPVAAAPRPARHAPLAAELPLWRFLWGAGNRRLQLAPGRPRSGAALVETLPELLALLASATEDAALYDGLRQLLERGLLEHWLREAAEMPALADATRALRQDERPAKLARFLDLASRAAG